MSRFCRFSPPESGLLVIWEITHRCNLKCMHCCTNSGASLLEYRELKSMDIVEYSKSLSRIATEIYITGGEPLCSRAFIESIDSFASISTPHYLATNGYFLTNSIAQKLKDAKFGPTTISIDGGTEATHNTIRGDCLAWQYAFRAIEHLKQAELPVRVSFVLTSKSVAEIQDLLQALDNAGVDELVINTMAPAGRGAINKELIPSRNQIQTARFDISSYHGPLRLDTIFGDSNHGQNRSSTCPAGKKMLYVAPNGDVAGCSWLYKLHREKYCAGNLFDNDLEEIIDLASGKLNSGYCRVP